MARKLTVKTVKAQAKIEIQPDASSPVVLASPAAGGQGPAIQPEATESYLIAGICGILASLLVTGLLAVQWFEWDEYHGGFTPVFPKMAPGGQMSMPAPRPQMAPPAQSEPAAEKSE